ncbi:MAG: 5-(carboxyamino)imidazole ribonucleotide synthase [Cyanobacteria bacterium QS_7_48_42]|jgi:5-(carboxyamino)imidazole ribonucleotide synthase|nr:MAG: 5-(carboxyamino)imidazole ribonucleotide synthase [Cyanobacteria bacterium QH_7_48_89]PSO70648.1 MAG: 5-(carboxyamino)imidazole ribonucleotide synthase [Cyanobacteria bacterium QH_3_48_40]PSO85162.1 MAG: 5-(carboxyamino)imidazole ribonucleotide synthase [Cyanobacteria bacterium QH_9_48_43]PSO86519.1 MAG: 5-(carboxyamino)imidazole ribonucleotide synthase [Cyanobacteria bacterium QS_3_48_167]PSO98095.1 MAG: 5-(carboxyamino)imidazole ribonucleotide synthase [Cyanobacteria bacterium SW_6_48
MSLKRVGVLGGGQLAAMMASAAEALGISLVVQTPSFEKPAVAKADDVVIGAVDDAEVTAQLARRCDVITFENEFINLEGLMPLAKQGVCFRPSLESLAPLLDKYRQRCYLQELGLPVPRFTALEAGGEGEKISSLAKEASWDFPVVVKARRHGYDGQGTLIFKDQQALGKTWEDLGCPAMLLEEFVPFERELAVIAARGATGEIAVYPVVETQQEDQVCHRVIAPAAISESVNSQIEAIAHTFLSQLQAVGVFGIELFLTPAGEVLVNEIAPRTHNSGHYTLDACETSQFEQQLRAVTGLPLGSPTLHCDGAVMVNLLGYEYAQHDYAAKREKLAQIPKAHLHWYGKTEPRPGRKLGHVTVLWEGQHSGAEAIADQISSLWYD